MIGKRSANCSTFPTCPTSFSIEMSSRRRSLWLTFQRQFFIFAGCEIGSRLVNGPFSCLHVFHDFHAMSTAENMFWSFLFFYFFFILSRFNSGIFILDAIFFEGTSREIKTNVNHFIVKILPEVEVTFWAKALSDTNCLFRFDFITFTAKVSKTSWFDNVKNS